MFRSRWRVVTASALCVLLLLSTVTTVAHSAGDRDADCAVGVVAHDAAAHAFTAPGTSETNQPETHCLACHWARAFRPRSEVLYVAAPAAEQRASLPVEALVHLSASIAAQPPLRAPPA
jgi:hypothetical protein